MMWYIRNFWLFLKYKLGLAKPGKDFVEASACFCDNMSLCPEDCCVCPFYRPDDI